MTERRTGVAAATPTSASGWRQRQSVLVVLLLSYIIAGDYLVPTSGRCRVSALNSLCSIIDAVIEVMLDFMADEAPTAKR